MRLQMCEALLGVADARDRSGRDPPESLMRLGHARKPLAAAAHDIEVAAVVDERPERVDRFQTDMFTISRSSPKPRTAVASPSSVINRQTKPGLESASALTGSSRATKSAISGLSSGAFISAMFTWARCQARATRVP